MQAASPHWYTLHRPEHTSYESAFALRVLRRNHTMNPAKYVSFGIYAGIGFALVNILFNCGGASTSQSAPNGSLVGTTNPNSGIDYRDYAPFRQSVCRDFSAGRWCSVITPNGADVTWGDSTEEFTVRPYAGELWVMLDAYREKDKRYGVQTTRVEVDYGAGWVSLPADTNPYSPITILRPFTLRQWGVIAGGKRYFWQHRIEPATAYNSCWLGIGDSTRPTLLQREVWWDEVGGWTRGTGNIKDGIPTGEVTMDFYQHIAKDAGYVWQGSGGLCLIR